MSAIPSATPPGKDYDGEVVPSEAFAPNVPGACAAPPNDKVLWWAWDTGSTVDYSGAPYSNSNTGFLTVAPGYVGASGRSFDGATDFRGVDPITPELTLATGSGITVEAWINPAQIAAQDPIVEWGSSTDVGAHFWHSVGTAGNLYVNLTEANGTNHIFSTTAGVVTAGAWQHVAFTYDAATGNARIYHNGTAQALTPGAGSAAVNGTTVTVGSITPETSLPFYVGHRPNGGDFYAGSMDELGVYDRALAASEIFSIDESDTFGQCQNSIGFASATSTTVETTGQPLNVINYTVNRTGNTTQPASILVNSAPGTALGDAGSGCSTPGSDFQNVPTNSVINFAANQTVANFAVTICNDTVPEGDETYDVTLSDPQGANTGLSSAPTITTNTTTITDDDFVTVQVRPAGGTLGATASVNEGTGATLGTNLEFVFTRTSVGPALAAPLTIGFNLGGTACGAGGTCAAPGNDYVITAGAGASGVTYVGPDGTNTTTTNTITFAAGSATAVMIVNPSEDADVEPNETVIVTPRSGAGTLGTAATGTILNDDTDASITPPAAAVNEGITPGSAVEGANLNFTVERTGANPAGQVINFNLTNPAAGSAAVACRLAICADGFPVDFVVQTGTTGNYVVAYSPSTNLGTITFTNAAPATTESAVIVINPTGDENVEGNETVEVNITNGTYDIVTASGTGTINNDDWNVTVTATDNTADEGTAGDTLTYTFTRNGVNAPQLTVLFTIATGNPTYAVWPADFTPPPTCGNGAGTCTIDAGGLTGTIVIPAGGTTASNTLTVTPLNDAVTEGNEQFIITVANTNPVTYYLTNPNVSAIGTITNDDATVTVAVSNSPISESAAAGQTMLYTFTRTGDLTDPLTVAFTVGGTATFNTDYTATIDPSSCVPVCTFATGASAGRVSFSAGSNEAYIRIDPTPDTDVEVGGETVTLTVNTLTGQNYTVGSPATAEGTITDDDTSVAVEILKRNVANAIVTGNSVVENGEEELVFRFTRTGITTGPLVVNYTISGDALNGTDYGLITATATIPAGQTSVDVIVDPTPDGTVEPNENVVLTIVANGALYTFPTTGGSASAEGFITNDDTTYRIVFEGITGAPVAGEEGDPGDSGETIATFRVFRDGGNSSAGTVDVATVPGSGTATAGAPNTVCMPGQDYTSDGETIAFTAGGPDSATFTVRICRDLVYELTETFDAQLSNPTGGVLGTPALATATIIDDDAAPVLTACDIDVNENAGTVTITVSQSVVTGTNTSFSYSTGAVGDTATAGLDYSASTGTGTIPAGGTSATFTIPILDDNIDEASPEFFTVNLSGAVNATIAATGTCSGSTVRVNIIDNESTTTFAVSDVRQVEGNPSTVDPTVASTSAFNFRITRTGDAQEAETVCFDTVDGDEENPILNPNPATGGTGVVPSTPFTGAPDYNRLVAGSTNCVTFTQGGPSVITVPVIVFGDPVFENDESFTFRLLTLTTGGGTPVAGGARFTDPLGLGLIQNDDGVVAFEISGPATVTEGNTDGGTGPQLTTLTYTITRPIAGVSSSVRVNVTGAATGNTLTATLGTSCGALNSGVDVAKSAATNPSTLTFPASGTGSQSQTFTVTVCGDLADELNETFTVSLDQPSNAIVGANSSVTTTIIDDDDTPFLTISDVVVCEPNTGTAAAVFTLTRNGLSFLTSTVRVNTVDGTAQDDVPSSEDNDYVQIVNQLVTFLPGETTKTVSVTVNGDLVFETDETFTLQGDATNVGPNVATNISLDPTVGADFVGGGIIQNNCVGGDAPPAFAVGPVTQAEGTTDPVTSAPFFVRLTRTGSTQVSTVITYSTSSTGGTATGGSSCGGNVDYINVSNATVAFPANAAPTAPAGGQSGLNFVDLPVEVCRDATFETNETFNVVINSAGVAGIINPTGSPATVTITNDDGFAFMIRNPGPEGAEGTTGQTTAFTFTIDKLGGSGVASTVCYQTIAGTATEGVDYTGLAANATNCVNFTAGGPTSQNVVVNVIGDITPETDETFFLRIISASGGATFPTVGSDDRIARINNDDGPIVTTGKEGDIVDGAGTPAGDGVLLSNDISVLRQYILGTASPATPSQFQRADIAPAPCGDGAINAADITLARQWLLNSTPLPDACGPTAPAGPVAEEAGRTNSPEALPRVIRASNVSASNAAGTLIVVPLLLNDAQGDESSASFTVNFNSAVFEYVSSAIGTGVPASSVLNVNDTQVGAGRLGVLVDSTNTYAAGTRQIATVTLRVRAGAAAGTYPVTFSSTPTPQSVSNPNGVLLATTYEAGNIVLTTTAAGVRVSGRVTTAGGQGLRSATVVLTDSEGNRKTATTGSFGIYTFEDVEAGQTYVVGVSARRYRFTSRVVNVTDSLADVNFVGQE